MRSSKCWLLVLILVLQLSTGVNAQSPTPGGDHASIQPNNSPTVSPSPSSVATSEPLRPEMITAIGSLWPLALVLLALTLALILNRPIRRVANNILDKFETADTLELKSWPPGIALSGVRSKSQQVAEESREIAGRSDPTTFVTSTDQSTTQSTATVPSSPERPLPSAPKSAEDWVAELDNALETRDVPGVDEIYQRMQEAEANAENRRKFEIYYLYVKFRLGTSEAIKKLEDLAKKPEAAVLAHRALGLCYEFANQLPRAVQEFELAIASSNDEEDHTKDTLFLANSLFASGNREDAYSKILSQLDRSVDPNNLADLYLGLAALYQKEDKRELQALALEKALESNPSNQQSLFDAGYSYGQISMPGLSLLHYKARLRFDPQDRACLNNAGVAYGNLEMPIHAVTSYKAAANLKNTLSSSNLANKYFGSGFADEAREILQRAAQEKDVHQNVGRSLANLGQQETDENKKEETILDSAIQQQRFLRSYADAYFVPKTELSFAGEWLFHDGTVIEIVQRDGKVLGEWITSGKKKKIEGDVCKQAARLTFHKMTYYAVDRELYYVKESEGYAYLSQDGQTLNLMAVTNNEHSFITLIRKNTEGSGVATPPSSDRP